MAALVSIDDLQTFLKRTFTGDDLDQADMALIGTSALVRAVSNQSWSDAPANVPEDVQQVVKLATKRLLERLKRDESVQDKTKGPFSVSYFADPGEVFTPAELAVLHRFRPQAGFGGLRTISTSRGELGRPRAGQVRLGVNGAPWTIFAYGDLGWWDAYGDAWDTWCDDWSWEEWWGDPPPSGP